MNTSHSIYMKALFMLLGIQRSFCSPAAIEERATCDADNVLRTFRASSNLPDALTFCSKYISLPPVTTLTAIATSTVTADFVDLTVIPVHPLYLYNLQHRPYDCSQRPVTYDSASPSPATVPGNPSDFTGACTNNVKARAPEPTAFYIRRATPSASSLSTPTFIASTIPLSRISSACSCLTVPFSSTRTISTATTTTITSTCLSYDRKPTATFPALCAPSLQANAPSVVSSPPNVKTVSPITVPDKLSCCAACVKIFNCVWWTFTFSNSKNPDPWSPGKCVYAYNIAPTGSPNIPDVQNGRPPVCPNGIVSGLLGQTSFTGKEGANKLSGYNQGPCGDALNTYESSQDFGYPDDDPNGNAPQC